MDVHRFDAIAKKLATAATRRAFMRGLAGTGAGALVAANQARRTTAAMQPTGEGTGVSTQPGCTETNCPAGQVFSVDACACVCDVVCRPNFYLDPATCNCYCSLSDFYVCPREDQVYDDNACECICAIEDCPGDAILDLVGCGCYCPDSIVCDPGEEIDQTTCECFCDRTCDAPLILDGCECVCGIEECDRAFIFDETGCACICDVTCDAPFVLDPETCECVCGASAACASPKTFDPDTCACVCPEEIRCTRGKVVDPVTCGCICPLDDICPGDQAMNPESCLCGCDPPVVCAAPKVEDPDSCTCICPPDVACPAEQTLDPETCACVCPAGTSLCQDRCIAPCLPTEAFTDDCRCEPIVCPPDRVLTCTCACPPGTAECKGQCLPACGPDEVFDAACRCVCRPNISCATGLTFDPVTCGCICDLTTCPSGKELDPTACQCICPPNQTCLGKQTLDLETCTCRCDVPPCPAGKALDRLCRCICSPRVVCRPGEVLNPVTCACDCKPGSLIETVIVPCTRTTVLSTATLAAGITYTLRASGTCRLGANNTGDAEYAYQTINPANPIHLQDKCVGPGTEIGIGINDPIIDGTKTPNWGPYTTTHVYSTKFTGNGAQISLNYHDCYFQDNEGSLKVEIFCPGTPAGDPVGTGTGVVTDLPPDGQCDITCPSGRTLDSQSCTCVCAAGACPAPYERDPTTCACVCPPSVTCPAGQMVDARTCGCVCIPGGLIESVTVPCARTPVVSTTTLQAGVAYTLRASGTCTIGYVRPYAPDADAEYAFDPANPMNLGGITDRCPGSSGIELGIGVDDPIIDGTKTPKWGPYNSSHVYSIAFTGKGAPITLNYHDCVHRDNVGSMTVDIFCPGRPPGDPADDSDTEGGSG